MKYFLIISVEDVLLIANKSITKFSIRIKATVVDILSPI